jgi:hypothetical protein
MYQRSLVSLEVGQQLADVVFMIESGTSAVLLRGSTDEARQPLPI